MIKIDCNYCNASKYAGFFTNETEKCLKFDKELQVEVNGRTVPCEECQGKYFVPDTWGE